MATSVSGELNVLLRTNLEPGITGVSGGVDQTIELFKILQNGTTSDLVDRVWYSSASLALSANTTIDLAGSLENIYGTAITFGKVKAIVLKNLSTTAGVDLSLGPNSSNGFGGSNGVWGDVSDRSTIQAQGLFFWYDPNGVAVTAGTADILYLANLSGSTSCAYQILILGTSV